MQPAVYQAYDRRDDQPPDESQNEHRLDRRVAFFDVVARFALLPRGHGTNLTRHVATTARKFGYCACPLNETNCQPAACIAGMASAKPAWVPDAGWFMWAITIDPGAAPMTLDRTVAADAVAP